MEVLSLGETVLSPGTIEYLTKAPVPGRETSIWVVGHWSWSDLQAIVGCCPCPWLPPRTQAVREDSTRFKQWPGEIVSSLKSSSHSIQCKLPKGGKQSVALLTSKAYKSQQWPPSRDYPPECNSGSYILGVTNSCLTGRLIHRKQRLTCSHTQESHQNQ